MHVILECIGLIVTGVPRQLLESFPGIFLTARTVVRSIFKNNKVSSVPSYEESLLEDIDLRELGQLQNFLLRTLESEEKEDTHAFLSGMGVMGRFTRPLPAPLELPAPYPILPLPE